MVQDVTSLGLAKQVENQQLKKHTAIIHCSNSLSLLQRKISNALLYHAYKELLTTEEHEISITQLCELISYKGHNHSAIKDALKGLISTIIEWNLVDDQTYEEDWTASAILASVNLKRGICSYAYSPRMKRLLYTPSMFGKINLYLQSHFRSSYGLALYENCTRYQSLPFTKWFEMDLFRKMMGVPEDTYVIFRDFKRRVLDKAIEEVNSFSDLFIEADFQKKGRLVIRIRFLLKERQKKKRLGKGGLVSGENSVDPVDANNELQFILINNYDLTPEITKDILKNYKPDYILEKMSIIESSKNFKTNKVENAAGLLIEALKKDYKVNSPKNVIQKNKDIDVKKINIDKDIEKEKNYKRYQTKIIIQMFNEKLMPNIEEVTKEFENYLGGSLYRDIYLREGMNDILIQDQLFTFLKFKKPELLKLLPTYDEFSNLIVEESRGLAE